MDIFVLIVCLFLFILSLSILNNKILKNPQKRKYSVLIACRNEEQNLPLLFNSLQKIDYPHDLFEIIIVDDASSDKSLSLIKAFCLHRSNCSYYHLPKKNKEYKGKKAALKIAVEKARFDNFLFTDADCVVSSEWISHYNNFLSDKTGVVYGYVIEKNPQFIKSMLNLITAGIYSSTAGLGIPFTASGGNMAVSKSAFLDVGGYEKIKNHISGDDKLLINLIRNRKWKISFNIWNDIQTQPLKTKREQLNQIKRRYGKFFMSPWFFQIISIFIMLFYLYLPVAIILNSIINLYIYLAVSTFFYLLLIMKLQLRFDIRVFLCLPLIPYLLIYYSILGIFIKWDWKKN